MRKRTFPTIALLAALVVYVAAYALIVQRSAYATFTDDGRTPPIYVIHGQELPGVVGSFFEAAHCGDMRIRHDYWYPHGVYRLAD